MSATLLYRIASVVFVLFAAGHTFGFMRFKPPTPEGRAVRDAMQNVRFEIGGRKYTYDGFYTGFGLFVTAHLLFSAFLAWHCGNLARTAPGAMGALGWAFFAVQVATLVLSALYFAPVTAVFSAVVALCLGGAAWLVK
jgi:hypothetical protein